MLGVLNYRIRVSSTNCLGQQRRTVRYKPEGVLQFDEIKLKCKFAQRSCSKCITAHPRCTWCNLESSSVGSINTNCRLDKDNKALCSVGIISPQPLVNNTRDEPFIAANMASVTNPHQLKPQAVDVKLRIGQSTKVKVTFRKLIDYPLDLYYLTDLSLSMHDDLLNLKFLGNNISDAIQNISNNARMGFGTFVDKVLVPFATSNVDIINEICTGQKVTCIPTFGFRHQLPITSDSNQFKEAVEATIISTNFDEPEGGFDALMQIAVCQDIVGWRKESLKVVLFTTDGPPHIALDGKIVRVFKPNDMKCHLKLMDETKPPNSTNNVWEYTESSKQDYPSVGQLKHAFAQSRVQTIFAVTSSVMNMYQGLSAVLPSTFVSLLNSDSSNVLSIIATSYEQIRRRFEFAKPTAVEGLTIKHRVMCHGSNVWMEGLECKNISIGQEVIMELEIMATECPVNKKQVDVINITSTQNSEVVAISVGYHCECSCEQEAGNNRSICNNHGSFICGSCMCDSGRSGALCQCQTTATTSELNRNCTDPKGTGGVCNNNGECDCGECKCANPHIGQYCHCRTDGCPSDSNGICGGLEKGNCVNCYEDKRCECKTLDGWYKNTAGLCSCNNQSCVATGSNLQCSGHGTCDCATCICPNNSFVWEGRYCQSCVHPVCNAHKITASCTDPQLVKCAQCVYEQKTCTQECMDKQIFTSVVTTIPDCDTCHVTEQRSCSECTNYDVKKLVPLDCTTTLPSDCVAKFRVVWHKSLKSYFLQVQRLNSATDCPPPVNLLLYILPTIGGVLLVGIISIIAYRIWKTNYDKRKYHEFKDEVNKSKWTKSANPIHIKATQHFMNPKYIGPEDTSLDANVNEKADEFVELKN